MKFKLPKSQGSRALNETRSEQVLASLSVPESSRLTASRTEAIGSRVLPLARRRRARVWAWVRHPGPHLSRACVACFPPTTPAILI